MTDDPRPTPPERPEDYMCCGRGCMPCIFDVYDQALTRHAAQLQEWETRRAGGVVEGYAPSAGVELYYRIAGQGLPLVVIHGGPDFDHRYLLPDIDRLADRYRVILYDQRGRGRSRGEFRLDQLGIDAYVQDLDGLRRHLGLQSMAIVGHSWGGIVAMHYALAYPSRLSHLVLLNSAPASHEDLVRMREERMRRRFNIAEQMGEFTAGYEAADPAAVAQLYHLDFGTTFARSEDAARLDLTYTREQILAGRAIEEKLQEGLIWTPGYSLLPRLSALQVPTLVVHGELDFIPKVCDERIAAAIPGARLVALEGSGHFSYLDAPDAFRQSLAGFL